MAEIVQRPMLPGALLDRIRQAGVIAVLVVERAECAVPLARALLAGGVDVMELALRTPAAVDALRRIRAELPAMVAGVGTVLTPAQVQSVVDAGAAFGVAPGTSRRVIRAARDAALPFAPGITTPSDLESALELDCRVVKFFPAEPSGGLAYLRSLAAPYDHLGVQYLPLGGIRPDHLAAYLAERRVAAVGGSWLATRDQIEAGDWSTITAQARAARQLVAQVRPAP